MTASLKIQKWKMKLKGRIAKWKFDLINFSVDFGNPENRQKEIVQDLREEIVALTKQNCDLVRELVARDR